MTQTSNTLLSPTKSITSSKTTFCPIGEGSPEIKLDIRVGYIALD